MSAGLLYPYQQRWLKDKARFKLGKFARQTGKTFTTTLEIVDDVHEAEIRKKRSPWVILSRGERQAAEAMEEGIMRHNAAYGAALGVLREDADYYDEESGIRRRALQLIYPSGNKITALPANPDTARGFSANVFLDEFAFHKDSRKIWTALFPVISAGWKLRVTSTPNGKGNKFYDLATSSDGGWSIHIVDILQAVAEGLPRDVDEMRKALMDEDAWDQEFLLKWLDEASAWLSFDLLNSVEHDHAGIPEHYTGGPCFVGVDIARRSDNFVIWVDELVGDVLWNRETIVRKRISFSEMDALQDDVERRYRVMRYCMDQTGMGEKPVEDAIKRYGQHRVEGVLFTGPNKLQMATLIKQSFEDRKSRIPMADEKLRADLHKVRKIPSPTGAPRFDADSDANGHADRFWAKAMACLAAHGNLGPTFAASRPGPAANSVSGQLSGYLS
ncbi:MAG: Phage terminase, large subunit [Spirosoma sp.]|nr:Phage terminase, large subunit [Spirosoma sp.]